MSYLKVDEHGLSIGPSTLIRWSALVALTVMAQLPWYQRLWFKLKKIVGHVLDRINRGCQVC